MGKKGVVGLVNLGNTCYANTAAQCLMHTMPLTYFFMLGKHADAMCDGPHKQVTAHWVQLLNVAWRDADTFAVSPKNFVRTFSTVSRQLKERGALSTEFRVGEQHDMVEYLQFLLDCFHTALKTKIEVTVRGTPCNRLDQLMVDSYEQYRRHYEPEYSVVIDMFSGQYYTQICTRDVTGPAEHSESFDPFTVLTLELPKAAASCSLYRCFDMLVRPEMITGWKGERCDKARLVEKKTYLWRLPSILVIHLKRFVNQYVKNTCQVEIPERLDLTNYCMGYDNENARYRLYAVANHKGTLHYGHYYADCRTMHHDWFRFDDQSVTPIDVGDLRSNHAYCLFYYREPSGGGGTSPEDFDGAGSL